MDRFTEEAKAAIGETFIPVLNQGVRALTEFSKAAREAAESGSPIISQISALGAGVAVGSAVGLGVGRFFPQAGLAAGLLSGGAAALLTGRLLDVDPLKFQTGQARGAITKIQGKIAAIEQQTQRFAAGESVPGFDPARAEQRIAELREGLNSIRVGFIDTIIGDLAKIQRRRFDVLGSEEGRSQFLKPGVRERIRAERATLRSTGGLSAVPGLIDIGLSTPISRVEIADALRRRVTGAALAPGESLLPSLAQAEIDRQVATQEQRKFIAALDKSRDTLQSLARQTGGAVAGLGGNRFAALFAGQDARRAGLTLDDAGRVQLTNIERTEAQVLLFKELVRLGQDLLQIERSRADAFKGGAVAANIEEIDPRIAARNLQLVQRSREAAEFRARVAEQEVRAREQIIELTAGPGGEFECRLTRRFA